MKTHNLTVKQIIDIHNAINFLNQQAIKLPTTIAYRIARISQKIKPVIETTENKRVELIEKYGTEDKKTKRKTIQPNDTKTLGKFSKEYEPMLTEQENYELHELRLKDFNDIELPPFFFEAFGELIEE
jgi:hypothetical protein